MAACVFDGRIATHVPAAIAQPTLGSGRAAPFRPHGRPAMPEWIVIDGGAETLTKKADRLSEAIAFAAANNSGK